MPELGKGIIAPTLVFLHEGLGCVAMWRDFPQQVADRLGAQCLVYSREGYGQSPERPPEQRWGVDWMQGQGQLVLPELLAHHRISNYVLVGHSDGATISLYHAAQAPKGLRGLVVLAPHTFVEPVAIQSIQAIRRVYESSSHAIDGLTEKGDSVLKMKLQKFHRSADSAFYGWNDMWTNSEFARWDMRQQLHNIIAPTLVIQGEGDEYGTMLQVDAIAQSGIKSVSELRLQDCGHSPHRDQTSAVLQALAAFVGTL